MKRRKMLALLLTASLALGIVGCGGTTTTTSQGGTTADTAAGTAAAGTEAAGSEAAADDNLVRGGVGDGEYKEAPMLAEMVESGELPPIEERLPDEPAVVEVDEIGVYGGTYVGAAFGPTSGQVDTEGLRFQSLLTIEEDLNTFKPNIIKGYDVNEDYTEYTIHLREGMKWSNGEVV